MRAVVRKAEQTDGPALIVLLRASDEGGHLRLDPGSVQAQLISANVETVFVAEGSGQLLGYAAVQLSESFAYTRPTAELTNLFVLPDFRRAGIGSMLLESVVTHCQESHVLELFARVNSSNLAGMKLYESLGLQRADHYEYRIKYY